MTTKERRQLRVALLDLGFKRTDTTMDDGFGRYTETFAKDDNTVVIAWGRKTGLADCGADFDHDPHPYYDIAKMTKACDGATNKEAT